MADTEEIKLIIKGILVSNPNVLKANALLKECEAHLEGEIPLRKLGFKNFVEFLKSIPAVVQVQAGYDYNPEVYPVVSNKSKHIDQLVSRQVSRPPKKRGFDRPTRRRRGAAESRPPSRPPARYRPNQSNNAYSSNSYTNSTRYPSNNGPCSSKSLSSQADERSNQVYYTQDAPQSTSAYATEGCIPAGYEDDDEDDDWLEDELDSEEEMFQQVTQAYANRNGTSSITTPPCEGAAADCYDEKTGQNEYLEDRCYISDKMITNFRSILEHHSEGIWAAELPSLYHKNFGVRFELHDLGYRNILSLVSSLPKVFSFRREGPHDWKLYDARYVTQESLDAKGEFLITESEEYIPDSIITNVKELLKKNRSGLRSTELLEYYLEEYNKPLKLDLLGLTMNEFVNHLRKHVSVKTCSDYYFLLPKHERISYEALQPPEKDERLFVTVESLSGMVPSEVVKYGEEIPMQALPPVQDSGPDDPLMELEVRIGEVMSPTYFYFMLSNSYESLENMMDDLHFLYQREEDKYKIPIPYIRKDLYCAVKYCEFWHRAKVVEVKGNGIAAIEYIDYGTPATKECSHLRFLTKDFAQLPAQAICGKLIGVKPKNNETKFTRKVNDEFLDMVTNKRLIAHVYQVTERFLHKQTKVQFEIILFDTENPKGEIVLNDHLIRTGLVSPIPPEESLPQKLEPETNPILESDPNMLSTSNILFSDVSPEENGTPPTLLPSGNASLPEDISSIASGSTLLPGDDPSIALLPSSNIPEKKITTRPPPGFKPLPGTCQKEEPQNIDMPSVTASSTDTSQDQSSTIIQVHNYYSYSYPSTLGLPAAYNQPPPNPSNLPYAGHPLYQSNSHILPYNQRIPSTNLYPQYQPVLPQQPLPLTSYFVPNQMAFQPLTYFVNQPVRPSYQNFPSSASICPHSSPFPTSSYPTSSPVNPSSSPIGSSGRSSYSGVPAPTTVSDWVNNLPPVLTNASMTKDETILQPVTPQPPSKSEVPIVNDIPRPATPLTPASAEVANICKHSRPTSSASQASEKYTKFSPLHKTNSEDRIPFKSSIENIQKEEEKMSIKSLNNNTLKEEGKMSFKSLNNNAQKEEDEMSFKSLIDNAHKEMVKLMSRSTPLESKLESPQHEIILDNEVQEAFSLRPSSLEQLSTCGSLVKSVYSPSSKDDSSDDYASAPEELEEVNHPLASLVLNSHPVLTEQESTLTEQESILTEEESTLTEQNPTTEEQLFLYEQHPLTTELPVSSERLLNEQNALLTEEQSVFPKQNPVEKCEPCDDSFWDNLDIDDTPLTEAHLPFYDIEEQLQLILDRINTPTDESGIKIECPEVLESVNEPRNVSVMEFECPEIIESVNEPTNESVMEFENPKVLESMNQPLNVSVNVKNESPIKLDSTNTPPKESVLDNETSKRSPLLKISQIPMNWKDAFDPDALSISRKVDNNNVQKKPPPEKFGVRKVPVQIIGIENKPFHLLFVDKKPAIVALEFLSQFVQGRPHTNVKVLELDESIKFFTINQTSHPEILAELNKLDGFFGEVERKAILKMNKVLVLNLADIPKCLGVLNKRNEPLFRDIKRLIDECSKL
ncbi:uncharacterized protein LOC128991457 isoform X1 [Macrosteles quadrilineatus]|uniref:uncharacterized protein LOC128991457 isoform X1 n=1 Tax=Macrosteles quadrilineatus TaxID=74068 RepID=UPI0023E21D30|nr:uncharacterized protein LOC128991457 isoform X1 [Macrosteles quadrilineatus]